MSAPLDPAAEARRRGRRPRRHNRWPGSGARAQRSLLSLGALVTRGYFAAFGDTSYPTHRTALLDMDLRRIGVENGLVNVAIESTCRGRMPRAGWHYHVAVSRAFPRACSDNLLLVGRKRT